MLLLLSKILCLQLQLAVVLYSCFLFLGLVFPFLIKKLLEWERECIRAGGVRINRGVYIIECAALSCGVIVIVNIGTVNLNIAVK